MFLTFTLRSLLFMPEGDGTGGGGNGDGQKPEPVTLDAVHGAINGALSRFLKTDFPKAMQPFQQNALTADKLAELGLLEKTDDGQFKPKAFQAEPPPQQQQKSAEESPEMKRLKALEKQLADKDAEVQREREEAKKKDIAIERQERGRSIIAALTKAGALNPERDAVHLMEKVTRGETGTYTAKGKDKYDVETDIPLDDVAEQFLKANPELKRATATPGSGTPASKGAAAPGGGTLIPYEQWTDMTFMTKHRDKFLSGEYVRGPKQ